MLKHLKIASPAWANFSGLIGPHRFENGVSVDPLPRVERDRMGAAMQMIEVDPDGNEGEVAGGAQRLIVESEQRAPVITSLATVTDEELADEHRRDAARAEVPPVSKFYTKEELEVEAHKEGIKGLREIGLPWGVKQRSIPALIELILKAQSEFLEKRDARIAAAAPPPATEASDEPLAKISTLVDKMVDVNGEPMSAEAIAAAAQDDSGVPLEEWNMLVADERNRMIEAYMVKLLTPESTDETPTEEPADEAPAPTAQQQLLERLDAAEAAAQNAAE